MHAQTDSSRLVFVPYSLGPRRHLFKKASFPPSSYPFFLSRMPMPQRPSKGYFRLSTYSECPYSICIAKQAKSAPEGTKVVFAKRKNTSAHKCHCPIFRLDTRAKVFYFCELNIFFPEELFKLRNWKNKGVDFLRSGPCQENFPFPSLPSKYVTTCSFPNP